MSEVLFDDIGSTLDKATKSLKKNPQAALFAVCGCVVIAALIIKGGKSENGTIEVEENEYVKPEELEAYVNDNNQVLADSFQQGFENAMTEVPYILADDGTGASTSIVKLQNSMDKLQTSLSNQKQTVLSPTPVKVTVKTESIKANTSTAKKSTAKKSTAKKSTAKKSTAKKSTAKPKGHVEEVKQSGKAKGHVEEVTVLPNISDINKGMKNQLEMIALTNSLKNVSVNAKKL